MEGRGKERMWVWSKAEDRGNMEGGGKESGEERYSTSMEPPRTFTSYSMPQGTYDVGDLHASPTASTLSLHLHRPERRERPGQDSIQVRAGCVPYNLSRFRLIDILHFQADLRRPLLRLLLLQCHLWCCNVFSSSVWCVYVHHGDVVSSRLGCLHERTRRMGHG